MKTWGKQLKFIFTNQFVLLYMIIYSIGWGCIPVLGSNLVAIIRPFGYPAWHGSICVALVIVVGLVSTVLYSLFFLKKPGQNTALLIVFVGSMSAFLFAIGFLQMQSIYYLLLVGLIYGTFA